jgi:hypothetical protein
MDVDITPVTAEIIKLGAIVLTAETLKVESLLGNLSVISRIQQ